MRYPSLILPIAALLCALAPPAAAGQVVEFVDGRALEVDRVLVDDGMIRLELLGGGSLAVPSARVRTWIALDAPVVVPLPRPAAPRRERGRAWRAAAGRWAPLFESAADRHGVDPALLTSMAIAESALNPEAVSHKGAVGLLQLMPATATRFGVDDRRDPAQNVDGGARYLSWLLDRFDGRTELAVAGYNAGEGAVDRHGGIPPYRETRAYVQRVMTAMERFETPAH